MPRTEKPVRSSCSSLQLIHPICHSRIRLFPVLNLGLLNAACAQKENIINFVIARADVTAIKKLRMRYRASVDLRLIREIPYPRERTGHEVSLRGIQAPRLVAAARLMQLGCERDLQELKEIGSHSGRSNKLNILQTSLITVNSCFSELSRTRSVSDGCSAEGIFVDRGSPSP